MADNLTTTTTVSTVPSGSVIATDDVGGVHFQKVKIDVGGDGASALLSNSNPLPISDAGGAVTVDGTVTSNPAPVTTGGLSVHNANSGDTYTALTNSAQEVKATSGQVYGWHIYNPNASAAYVILYNVVQASVTVGTTTAAMIVPIGATREVSICMPYGIPFDTAISVAAATTAGGNTAPTTALEAMIYYK